MNLPSAPNLQNIPICSVLLKEHRRIRDAFAVAIGLDTSSFLPTLVVMEGSFSLESAAARRLFQYVGFSVPIVRLSP